MLQWQIQRLYELEHQLGQSENLDILCRNTVEFGYHTLRLGRLSIWRFDIRDETCYGTFEFDETKTIRDLRETSLPPNMLVTTTDEISLPHIDKSSPLYNPAGEVIGEGVRVMISLYEDDNSQWILIADNLFKSDTSAYDVTSFMLMLAALFRISYTHLISSIPSQNTSNGQYVHIDAIPAPLIIYDATGQVQNANTTFEELFKWQTSDIIGSALDFIPQELKATTIDPLEKYSTEASIFEEETRRLTRDNQPLDVQLSGSLIINESGQPQGWVEMFQDITLRKQHEYEIGASEQRLRAAFDASPVPIITYDVAGAVSYLNPAFTALFGWQIDELLGRFIDFVPIDRQSEYQESSVHLLSFDRIANLETQRRTKNNTMIDIYLNAALFRDRHGNPIGSVEILQDITERKEFEIALLEAKNEADRANQAKSIFLANMTHEIRTPMNAILGYAQIMMRDKVLQSTWYKQLSVINRSGEHLLALIDEILELSRIEAGQIALNESHIDLKGLIQDLEAMFKVRTDIKNLHLGVYTEKDIPRYIEIDDGKLRQILINLLSNAIKFTDRGAVTFRASSTQVEANQCTLIFEVEDTGVGISPEDQARIFEQFEQTLTGQKKGGTGLGLAISRQYAQLLNGDITLESQPGKGSIFRLICQVKLGDESQVHSIQSNLQVVKLADETRELRILVVDDRETNRDVLVTILKRVGFVTQEAVDGKEAIDRFQDWKPHLIFMDVVMPVFGGEEAIKRIRAMPGGDKVVIIVLSASVLDQNKIAALVRQADSFLLKPFREAELFETVRQNLDVQFIYEEKNQTEAEDTEFVEADVLALDLPEDLTHAIEKATLLGQIDQLRLLIDQVAEYNNPLAIKFSQLVDRYDYDSIRRLLVSDS